MPLLADGRNVLLTVCFCLAAMDMKQINLCGKKILSELKFKYPGSHDWILNRKFSLKSCLVNTKLHHLFTMQELYIDTTKAAEDCIMTYSLRA